MFRYVIGLLLLALGIQAIAAESLVILKTPLEVVATYEEPGYEGKDCGLFTVILSVSDGSKTESEKALPLRCGNAKRSLKSQLRKLVSWRPPYLALHTNCGLSNGWNCDTKVIYSYRNGKLTRLGHVNALVFLSGQTYFRKNYTVIEYNDLVAHTGASLPLVLRDDGSAFEFDAGMTWKLNHERYNKFLYSGSRCDAKRPKCEHNFKVAAVFNSTLAKLTGKQPELQSVLARAKIRLSEEEFRQLTDMLLKVDDKGVIAHMVAETH